MAYEIRGHSISLDSVTDLSTKQYLGGKITAANTVGVVSASTDNAIGIIQGKIVGTAGNPRAVEVMVSGVSKAVAGAAVTVGSLVMFDANGKVVNATATHEAIGTALEGCSNANEIISVLIQRAGKR